MIYMEFNIEPNVLKSIVNLDSEDIVSFEPSDENIEFRVVDEAHVSILSIVVKKETLSDYSITDEDKNNQINIKKDILKQILSLTSPSDNIHIIKENSNTLKFEFGLMERTIKTLTATVWSRIPKIDFGTNMFTMKTEYLGKIIDASKPISDSVMFIASDKGVSIGSKSVEQTSKIAITKDLLGKKTFKEQVTSTYPVEYLNRFARYIPSDNVDIYFGNNMPINIKFTIPSNTKINPEAEILIAPRIDTE